MSNLDIQGNAHADELAGKAAVRFSVPLNVSATYLYYTYLTYRIQYRLATILVNTPNRPKAKAEKGPVPLALCDLYLSSSHVLHESECRVYCARCGSSFHKKDPSLRKWLSLHCQGIGSDKDRPIPIPLEQVHRGNAVTHVSHRLYTFNGLVYCNRCGCRAGVAGLRKLGHPCEQPTTYGKASLAALCAGKKPPGLVSWPSGAGPL